MSEPKEVDQLFVLMTGKYRVSRNTRAQWYFNHLNQEAKPSNKTSIVSALQLNEQHVLTLSTVI